MPNNKLTTVYKPNGKSLKVNDYMVSLLKKGDKSFVGWSLKKPEASK